MANGPKLSKKLKDAAAKSGAIVLPHIPRVGLNFIAKKLRKKMEKHYDENPEGWDDRKLRYVRGFSFKMVDVFLATSKRISPNCRYRMLNNIGNNAIVKGKLLRKEFEKKIRSCTKRTRCFSIDFRRNFKRIKNA